MTLKFTLRTETPNDIDAIASVHLAAFGTDEPIPALVDRLRHLDAPLQTISLVAEDASGEIIGHLMMSHSWLDAPDRLIDILVLSPLGVQPSVQRQGVGKALIAEAITMASQTTAPILILEGSPTYYSARGFVAAATKNIRRPSLRIPEAALQMVTLPAYDPEMTGSLVYRELWWDMDCVGLR